MACECTNEDGTLSLTCRGTCKLKSKIIEAEKNKSRDPLNGFSELILSQVNKMIDSKMKNLKIDFEKQMFKRYKEAFVEGFKEGFETGREETF